MLQIPIINIPNQSFTVQLDNNVWDFSIYDIQDLVAVDVTLNGTQILTGERAMPSYPLIPYKYLESGNFVFLTDNDDYPDFHQFGITQYLIYASETELESIRAGT